MSVLGNENLEKVAGGTDPVAEGESKEAPKCSKCGKEIPKPPFGHGRHHGHGPHFHGPHPKFFDKKPKMELGKSDDHDHTVCPECRAKEISNTTEGQ